MLIAQISDTHISLTDENSPQRIADFEAVIADINAHDPLPDVIIHSGDIVHNGRADEYAVCAEILSLAKPPVFTMVGNKDDRKAMLKAFEGAEYLANCDTFVHYTIEDFPVLMVMLDTKHATSNKGDFCERRAGFLADALAGNTDKPVAIFAHHPPITVEVGPEPMHFVAEPAMRLLRDALTGSSRVTGVFCGHVHRETTGKVGDIPVNIMSAVATTQRRGDYPAHMAGKPVYQLHEYADAHWITQSRIVGL